MLVRGLDHVEVNLRTLVPGKADEADLAFLAAPASAHPSHSRLERLLRITHADHFMNLHQIDVIRLEPRQ